MSRQYSWTSSVACAFTLKRWAVERKKVTATLKLCWWSPMHQFMEGAVWEEDLGRNPPVIPV